MDFISIDFEIANYNYDSACALGMVFVENNKIIDKKYYLIQPPGMKMDQSMTKVHGLTYDQLSQSPTFEQLWPEIKESFNGDTLIVAHNAQFDMNVLKNTLMAYTIDIPDFNYACSIPISTRACRGEGVKNSLEERAKRFDVTLEEHHNALSDAKACAEIIIKCVSLKNRKNIHTYISTFTSIPIRKFSELKLQTKFSSRGTRFKSISIKEISATTEDFDQSHPFFGKSVVLTGELQSIERKDAMQQIINKGGKIKSAVSSKTDYLIVGVQDKTVVGPDGLSSKERKAKELIEKGKGIQILKENEFMKMIES